MKQASCIRADAMYRRVDLQVMGIGSVTLAEARQSGMVRPVSVGKSLWYSGEELIKWMRERETRGTSFVGESQGANSLSQTN